MDSLISVRRASLFGPIPVSRTPRVAGRLPAVPRDNLERVTCRATNDIPENSGSVCRGLKSERGGSRVRGVANGGPSLAFNDPTLIGIDPVHDTLRYTPVRSLYHN